MRRPINDHPDTPLRPPRGSSEYGRQVAELRRSGAAGSHGKQRKDRRNAEREAVERDMDASA